MHLDQDARYLTALKLVSQIDQNLATGRHHYRDCDGRLLQDLGQVVHAILADALHNPPPPIGGRLGGGEE